MGDARQALEHVGAPAGRPGLGMSAVVLALTAAAVVASRAPYWLGILLAPGGARLLPMLALSSSLLMVGIPLLAICLAPCHASLGGLRLWSGWRDVAWFLALSAGLAVAALLGPRLVRICGLSFGQPHHTGPVRIVLAWDRNPSAVLLLLVCAPAAEEFFYRGFIYGQLKRLMPVPVAVLAQACLCALLHFRGPGLTCVLLLYGLTLGAGRAFGAQFLALAGAHVVLNVGWLMSVS